jgi:hypothetical protein
MGLSPPFFPSLPSLGYNFGLNGEGGDDDDGEVVVPRENVLRTYRTLGFLGRLVVSFSCEFQLEMLNVRKHSPSCFFIQDVHILLICHSQAHCFNDGGRSAARRQLQPRWTRRREEDASLGRRREGVCISIPGHPATRGRANQDVVMMMMMRE